MIDDFTFGKSEVAVDLARFLNNLRESGVEAERIRNGVSSLVEDFKLVINFFTWQQPYYHFCKRVNQPYTYDPPIKYLFYCYYKNTLDLIQKKPWRSPIKCTVVAFVRQTAKDNNLL